MSGGYFGGSYFGSTGGGVAEADPITLAPSEEGANRQRILTALRQIAADGPFFRVDYDADGLPTIGDATAPAAIEANEVRARFAVPVRNRRADLRERQSWPFVLLMHFPGPQETTVEEWEQALQTPVVVREAAVGSDTRTSRAFRIYLSDVSYQHPPRGGGSATGTQVVANFDVQLSPL